MIMDVKELDGVLVSWEGLNRTLQSANEETCKELLAREIAHKKRKQFLLRIHSRLNKVRAQRERAELVKHAI